MHSRVYIVFSCMDSLYRLRLRGHVYVSWHASVDPARQQQSTQPWSLVPDHLLVRAGHRPEHMSARVHFR